MPRCTETTKAGRRCKNHGTPCCRVHDVVDDDCSICMSPLYKRNAYDAGCAGNHQFHKSCMMKWFARSNTCPMCRDRIVNPMSKTRDDLIEYMRLVIQANAVHVSDGYMTVFDMDDTFRLERISFAEKPSGGYLACFRMAEEPIMYFIRG